MKLGKRRSWWRSLGDNRGVHLGAFEY